MVRFFSAKPHVLLRSLPLCCTSITPAHARTHALRTADLHRASPRRRVSSVQTGCMATFSGCHGRVSDRYRAFGYRVIFGAGGRGYRGAQATWLETRGAVTMDIAGKRVGFGMRFLGGAV